MDFAKIWLPLGLTIALAGCNPAGDDTDKNDDQTGNTDTASTELALAKAFVQDFAGLQNSLMALETPAIEFAQQIETDLMSADEADAEAFGRAFEAVLSQLNAELETMITDDETGFRIDFSNATGADTLFAEDIDLGVTFSGASVYSITDAGVISAEGVATVDVDGFDETVAFSLTFALPEIDDQATGSITYVLNASINFTADTLALAATNAGGTLKLELGDKTLAELDETGPQGSEFTSLEIGVDALSLDIGALSFDGASTVSVGQLSTTATDSGGSLNAGFSIANEGKLTASDASYLQAAMTLSATLAETYSDSETGYSDSTEVNVGYSFTTTFKTSGHDFNVTTEGTFNGDFAEEENWDQNTWSEQATVGIEGDVTITHNGAEFKIDYDFDYSGSDSQNSESEQIDMVIQDATVTTDTVIIVLGDFDDTETDALEFGQVKVNGTRYGTLFNDAGATKAKFTDGSSVVVFDGL